MQLATAVNYVGTSGQVSIMECWNNYLDNYQSRDGRSKVIGLKTLLSLLPLLYRFSEGYSESLHLHRREKNVQRSKIHSLT